jgi:hypothetical protein
VKKESREMKSYEEEERDQAILQIVAAGHQAQTVRDGEFEHILVRRCRNGEPMKDDWDRILVMYYDQWLDDEEGYHDLAQLWTSIIAMPYDAMDDHSNFGIY